MAEKERKSERERKRERGRGKVDESEAECKGVEKRGWSLVTMRSAGGGWGLLNLFEDQEEDVEEARETQTVVSRESDGCGPARAR